MSPANGFIKIEYQGVTRRLSYNTENGIEGLKALSANLFSLKKDSCFSFTYKDSDGDTIHLSGLDELALQFPTTPKIAICLTRAPEPHEQAIEPKVVSQEEPKVLNETNIEQEVTKPEKKKKEAKKEVRAKILETKAIRLSWRNHSEDNNEKESFFRATKNGNLQFKGKKERKDLWLIHRLESGQFLLSPMEHPDRFLRMTAKGRVDLSEGGMGKRTRWSLVSEEENGPIVLTSLFSNLQLGVIRKGEGKRTQNKKDGKCNGRLVPHGISTSSLPENLMVKEFNMEEVNDEIPVKRPSPRAERQERQQKKKAERQERKRNPSVADRPKPKKQRKEGRQSRPIKTTK